MALSSVGAAPSLVHEPIGLAAGAKGAKASPWLLGPVYDPVLIANVAWPLLLVLQIGEGFNGREGIQFWQVYFLSTPHRWVTLALVFFDRERFDRRRGLFFVIAAAVIALCAAVRLTTGTLLCLLAVDYVWNAWHFASQHHGIYRIYSHRGGLAMASGATLEKWTMRLLLLYVIVRVAGATWRYATLEAALAWVDWLAWAAAAWLLIRDFMSAGPSWPQRLYLVSVMALYSALLAAVHWSQPALVLSLATASAVFHATEYLALVTWSVKGREASLGSRMGMLGYLAPRWGLLLGVFMLILGAGGWMLEQRWLQPWLMVNVIVAFLHYAYDGLIWRRGG
jgi:hypothetical protein